MLFTSDAVIGAQVRGLEGTLLIKNAGAFNTTGAGDIVDAQTIVGGTSDFGGATGGIRPGHVHDRGRWAFLLHRDALRARKVGGAGARASGCRAGCGTR